MRAALSPLLVLLVSAPAVASDITWDNYAAFSSDGLLFAYVEGEAPGQLLRWVSTTTNTIERTSQLGGSDKSTAALSELKEEGLPAPTVTVKIPKQVSAEIRDGLIYVLFSGMPAAKPFKPFADRVTTTADGVTVAAVSADGKRVAVKITGHIGATGAATPEYHVVSLFE